MTSNKSAVARAVRSFTAACEFRAELRREHPVYRREFDITATHEQTQHENRRISARHLQNQLIGALEQYEPLFANRLEFERPGDTFRLHLSGFGTAFSAILGEDGDDILVSWAHPNFLELRDCVLGDTKSIGSKELKLIAVTRVNGESRGEALLGVEISDNETPATTFARVCFVNGVATALEEAQDTGKDNLSDSIEQTIAIPIKSRLALDTVVLDEDQNAVAIPFALDGKQWSTLRAHSSNGTILLVGPPGTGKTTVALLRATTLANSIYQYDEKGVRVSDAPTVDLKVERFRVFVVTQHLRNYLKDFLSSQELGLPSAQVVDLRGAFLESFLRHRTLRLWLRGMRFRSSQKKNRLSDNLIYIKSLPHVLHLGFSQALRNARMNAGVNGKNLVASLESSLLSGLIRLAIDTLVDVTQRQSWHRDFDQSESPEGFIKSRSVSRGFHDFLTSRRSELAKGKAQISEFIDRWISRAEMYVDAIRTSSEEILLAPGFDDLLLSRFVENCDAFIDNDRERNLFVRETWRALINLIDPQEVLLGIVSDLSTTSGTSQLKAAGLAEADAMNAANEWRQYLSGEVATNDDEDDEETDEPEIEEIESGLEAMRTKRGAITRSDFPLLAAFARVFLAQPCDAKRSPQKYSGIGFLLPDDVARYDHIIVDEGQDFTYAELHLVRSLVEDERSAVTISGDPYQRMDWRFGNTSLESIMVSEGRKFAIRKNYRQTIELAEWVHRLGIVLFELPSDAIETGFAHGTQPIVSLETTFRDAIRKSANSIRDWYLKDRDPFTAVLPIGFDKSMTRIVTALSNELERDMIHAQRIDDGRQIDRGPVTVALVPTVKGLEFESVVVIVSKDACKELGESSPKAQITKNMLYVACSRAKTNLTVIFQDKCHPIDRVFSQATTVLSPER